MRWTFPNLVVVGIRVTLVVAIVAALFLARWSMAFVATATLVASFMPEILARRMALHLPLSFLTAIVVFIFCTLFLGEVFDFYGRFWWWDVVLHGGSAIGFGMVGFLFVFYLFEGDKYAAPAWAIAFVSYCLAVAIGVTWEIFEYGMDQTFGLNMQKSGLQDTMWDLIVDSLGASIGAASGFLYLKGQEMGGLTHAIRDFIQRNRELFRRSDNK